TAPSPANPAPPDGSAQAPPKAKTRKTPPKPRALPVDLETIPAGLKALAQWVVWRYVPDADPETGETSWNKPPANARTGGLASSTNPATWSDFQTAAAAYQSGKWDGIGFVLNRKPGDESPGLVAVDLDKCRDPGTGRVERWAWEIVLAL